MKSKIKLKEIDIKNRVWYYFDDIINGTKINFGNILSNKKLYDNISVHINSNESLTWPKPLRMRFDKIGWFIISLDGKIKHLVLFDYGLLDKICDKTRYLISKKSDNANSINYNFENIKIDSYNSLLIKKVLTFHNVIILIKSFVDKNKKKYYHNILLEKGSLKTLY